MRAAMGEVRSHADPLEWLVYSRCASRSRCTAELRFLGLPETALAVDHYRVTGDKARRTGASQIELALITDAISDCPGTYPVTKNPTDLLACSAR